jgi:hypothetical protein
MIYDWCRERVNRDQEVVERKAFAFIVTLYIEYNLTPNMKQETSHVFSSGDVCSLAHVF